MNYEITIKNRKKVSFQEIPLTSIQICYCLPHIASMPTKFTVPSYIAFSKHFFLNMCYYISLLAIQSLGIHPSATCVRIILLFLIGETEKKQILSYNQSWLHTFDDEPLGPQVRMCCGRLVVLGICSYAISLDGKSDPECQRSMGPDGIFTDTFASPHA